jgi:hypothetical protein
MSSFIESVIQSTKNLESLLTKELGATGKGLHEKATSVEHLIPAELLKKIRYIASVRNKLMHESDYVFDGNPDEFLKECDRAFGGLNNAAYDLDIRGERNPDVLNLEDVTPAMLVPRYHEAQPEDENYWKNIDTPMPPPSQPKTPKKKRSFFWILIAAGFVGLIGLFIFAPPTAQPESDRASSSAPTPTKPTAPTPADVPTKLIDDYAGTYDALSCTFDFYNVGKQFFIKEQDGCGNQIYELIPVSATSFKFVKDIPYSPYNGTVDFISKNGKTSGLQITNRTERKFYKKVK